MPWVLADKEKLLRDHPPLCGKVLHVDVLELVHQQKQPAPAGRELIDHPFHVQLAAAVSRWPVGKAHARSLRNGDRRRHRQRRRTHPRFVVEVDDQAVVAQQRCCDFRGRQQRCFADAAHPCQQDLAAAAASRKRRRRRMDSIRLAHHHGVEQTAERCFDGSPTGSGAVQRARGQARVQSEEGAVRRRVVPKRLVRLQQDVQRALHRAAVRNVVAKRVDVGAKAVAQRSQRCDPVRRRRRRQTQPVQRTRDNGMVGESRGGGGGGGGDGDGGEVGGTRGGAGAQLAPRARKRGAHTCALSGAGRAPLSARHLKQAAVA